MPRPTSAAPLRLLALSAALALTAIAPGQTETADLDHWSRMTWNDALDSAPDRVVTRLREIPLEKDSPGAAPFLDATGTWLDRLRAQAQARFDAYEEAMTSLEAHVEQSDYREALADAMIALEMALDLKAHEITATVEGVPLPSQSTVLEDPRIRRLIDAASAEARAAEDRGDWLASQDLYFRLNELLTDTRDFQKDLERVSRRLGLIRFYLPERLRELTNKRLIEIGQDPRPAYEGDDEDDWRDMVEGVELDMVVEAAAASRATHIDSATTWTSLFSGGLASLETFVTTSDLAQVFPGLADEAARRRFIEAIAAQRAAWNNPAQPADQRRFAESLRRLSAENRATINLPDEVFTHEFGEGVIATLDPFSDLIWPYEYAMFARQLDGNYTGVGIQITLDEAFQLTVVTPLEDSPALRAGIRADDLITAVNGRSTAGISINQAVDQITGPEGTDVTLTIQRGDEPEPREFTLRRSTIKIDSVKGWKHRPDRSWQYLIDDYSRVAYIRLTGYLPETAADFDDALEDLKAEGARALILDLRFNPGGQLGPAVDICRRFVEQGVIVSTVGPDGRPDSMMARRQYAEGMRDFPVAVLINNGSASASEIVAGCLQDHNRALIVGTRSYGKGSVQKVRPVAGGQALLRITTEHYALPDGRIIHREDDSVVWGIDPDITVRMTPEEVAAAFRLRQNADIILDQPGDREQAEEDAQSGDLQLETALILLRTRLLGEGVDHAMLPEKETESVR